MLAFNEQRWLQWIVGLDKPHDGHAEPSTRFSPPWRWFFLIWVVGCGFHVLVFFVGLLALLLCLRERRLPPQLAWSVLVVGGLCFFAMKRWSWRGNPPTDFGLDQYFYKCGLGLWSEKFGFWQLPGLMAVGGLLLLLFSRRQDRLSACTVIWYVLVCVLIPLSVFLRHYFVNVRQLLFLVPFSFYFVAVCLDRLSGARTWIWATGLTLLMAMQWPQLQQYYHTEKSDVGPMMMGLVGLRAHAPDQVYLEAGWELSLFRHYAPKFGFDPSIFVAGADFNGQKEGRVFLVHYSPLSTRESLLQQGFQEQPSAPVMMLQTTLWVRPAR